MRSRSASAGCLRLGVDRAQRLRQRRKRLHRGAHDERLAGRHAALEPAGVVRLANVAALVVPEDLVVRLRADATGELEAVADRDALHRVDRHHRPREAAVEAVVPRRVRAEPGHERRTRAPRRRRRGSRSPSARCRSRRPSPRSPPDRGSGPASRRRRRSPPAAERSRSGAAHRADLEHVAVDASRRARRRNAFASAPTATRAAVSRALARSSTLRHVGVPELEHAGEVGVARDAAGGPRRLRLDRPGFIRSSQLA